MPIRILVTIPTYFFHLFSKFTQLSPENLLIAAAAASSSSFFFFFFFFFFLDGAAVLFGASPP